MRADIVEENSDGISTCRCKHCKKLFIAGGDHHWHNFYYCSPQCAHAANECSICGGNRNWGECWRDR